MTTTNLITCFGEPLGKADATKGDFNRFLQAVSSNFKINYFDTTSLFYDGVQMIYKEAQIRGWSKKYFFEHLHKFLLKQKYPNFTLSDFFDIDYPKLKTHKEYLDLLEKHGKAANIDLIVFRTKDAAYYAYENELTEDLVDFIKEKLQCKEIYYA